MIGGTAKHNPRRPLADHTLAQHLHQARFANAGLAAQEYDLPHPILALRPALQEQRHFRVTAYERRVAGGAYNVQAALGRTFPEDMIYLDRRSQALESVSPQILVGKISLHELKGCGTDCDRIRCGEPLEAGRHIGGFSQG